MVTEIYKVHHKQKNMIQNILDLLEIAKEENARGEFIDIALGKNKLPQTIKEGLNQYKRGLWEK